MEKFFQSTIRKHFLKVKKGFTLIEMLLYASLIAILLFAVSTFLQAMLELRIKNQAISEVNQQGAQALQIITQIVRNSTSFNSPARGASASSASVNVVDLTKSPTIFNLSSDGAIMITEGTNPSAPLTSTSSVSVSNLNFQNLSYSGTPGILRITFTISYLNPFGRSEYNYSQKFYASAESRK